MLKLSEFSQNHPPSGVKMLRKNPEWNFSLMKTNRFHLLLIVYILIMACGIFTTRKPVYENDAFRVDLPDGWIWGGSYYGAGTQLFTIRNSGGFLPSAKISVATLEHAERHHALEMTEQAYSNHGVMWNAKTQDYEGNPVSGEEIYFYFGRGGGTWTVREIWLENDGVTYILSFSAIDPFFDKYMGTYEQMLESLRFIEK